MIGAIAEHIKTHRHQLGKHALFIGSAAKIPPRDLQVDVLIQEMAVKRSADRVASLEPEQRASAAIQWLAESVTDHAERCRLFTQELGDEARPAEGHVRLAKLIKDGYYSMVFVGEPDDMLERALHAQHLGPEKDYHRLVAGVDDPNDIKIALTESTRIAIIKCGGDLAQSFLPLTDRELADVAGQVQHGAQWHEIGRLDMRRAELRQYLPQGHLRWLLEDYESQL